MKNQDVNPLDENFEPKDPTKKSNCYVMELGSSHYDKVGNKSKVASWRFDHEKDLSLITRESGHIEYYAKESHSNHGRISICRIYYASLIMTRI
ncbi:hypothetical protein Hanom_Chr06g00540041 [Helianthus anomalus]